MIPIPSGVRVWLATGHTDMRRGMNSLTLQVQERLKRDPHAGDLYVFRGKSGHLIKVIWHDGIGMSLYAKRLERGRFIWPSPADGVVAISAAQLAYMLDGIALRVLVLQGDKLGNRITPALRARAPVDRPPPAGDRAAGMAGAPSGLPLGPGQRLLALRRASPGHREAPLSLVT